MGGGGGGGGGGGVGGGWINEMYACICMLAYMHVRLNI